METDDIIMSGILWIGLWISIQFMTLFIALALNFTGLAWSILIAGNIVSALRLNSSLNKITRKYE